jgi:hypothetical protein
MNDILKKVKEISKKTKDLNVNELAKNNKLDTLIKLLKETMKISKGTMEISKELMEGLSLDKNKVIEVIEQLEKLFNNKENKKQLEKLFNNKEIKIFPFLQDKIKTRKFINNYFSNKHGGKLQKKMVGGDPTECPICYQSFENDGTQIVICPATADGEIDQQHRFHMDCILSWLFLPGNIDGTCPTCRCQWNPFEQELRMALPEDEVQEPNQEPNRLTPFHNIHSFMERQFNSIITQINNLNFSEGTHLGITAFISTMMCAMATSRSYDVDDLGKDIFYLNIILYFISYFRRYFPSFGNETPLITIYRVQQYIYILLFIVISLSFFQNTRDTASPASPASPASFEGDVTLLMSDVKSELNKVTLTLLRNITAVDPSTIERYIQFLDSQQSMLQERRNSSTFSAGSNKLRRKKSYKRSKKINKRRKSNKKLNRKTRRKVMNLS